MEIIEPTLQMWLAMAIVAGAIAAYSIDRIPLEISSFCTVTVLLLLFEFLPLVDEDGVRLITNRDLLAGFGDPALVTILALLVVGQGLVQTGALNAPAQYLVNWGTRFPHATILASFITVMAISAVLNNTPVVVMFIPILAVLAEKLGKKTGSVMMPLSFVAILGGNLTLIGSSTNLLAVGAYTKAGGAQLDFFEFTVPGAFLALTGFFYVAFVVPRNLKVQGVPAGQTIVSHGKQFLFQIELTDDNKLIGQTAVAGLFPDLQDVTVRMIQRGREKLLPPYDDITLKEGDIIMLAATRSVMTELLNISPDIVSDVEGDAHEKTRQAKQIAEAVVAPASRLDGRTLAQSAFRLETGCAVIGVQRRSRMIRVELSQLRLEAGDVLMVMGSRENVLGLRGSSDVLLMESSTADLPKKEFAGRAQFVFALVVGLAAMSITPIVVAALLGAVLTVALGCLNVRQAGRAIDRRVFAIVGAALALGTALEATGGAAYLAHFMIALLAGAPVWVMLSCLFLLVAVFTNILSNNATAVLFTPISMSLAAELGADQIPFLVTVIFAANCSFATPMSYQTNLLVMAPGHYRFSDFLRAGTPLIFVIWLMFTIFVPWYYGLV